MNLRTVATTLALVLSIQIGTAQDGAASTEVEYSAEDVKKGQELFDGTQSFRMKGPSCITCHNVNDPQLTPGGLLGPDLTNVYGKGEAFIHAFATSPSVPAMRAAYGSNPIDSAESAQLVAFFQKVHTPGEVTAESDTQYGSIAAMVVSGTIVGLILVAMLWFKRKKGTVKDDIFNRQIKSTSY